MEKAGKHKLEEKLISFFFIYIRDNFQESCFFVFSIWQEVGSIKWQTNTELLAIIIVLLNI